jgi:RimJ/RimL family protein N-acetyltransferase
MVQWDEDCNTQRFFEFPPLPPYDEHLRRSWWVIRRFHQAFARGDAVAYVVIDARSGQSVGTVELHHIRGTKAEISFMTVPTRRREGIATRSVRLLCSNATTHFGIRYVVLEHQTDNIGSQLVAERSGFTRVRRIDDWVTHQLDLTP